MTAAKEIHAIDDLVGMSIISRVSGNKLGQVGDLVVEPVGGALLGLTVQTPDGATHQLDYRAVHSFGEDVVMAKDDDALAATGDDRLSGRPLAKSNLIGTRITTENGKVLGQIANVHVRLATSPLVIYEIRESLLDKLLGRGFYLPASVGRAISDDNERLIVPDDAATNAADTAEAVTPRLIAPFTSEQVVVRYHEPAERVTGERVVVTHDPGDAEEETVVSTPRGETGAAGNFS